MARYVIRRYQDDKGRIIRRCTSRESGIAEMDETERIAHQIEGATIMRRSLDRLQIEVEGESPVQYELMME